LQVGADGGEGFGAIEAVKATADLVVLWGISHSTTYVEVPIMWRRARLGWM
jgi:hypothetical protein